MAAPVDVLAVLGSLNLADPDQRPGLSAARAAVRELISAARFAADSLDAPGAPTRPERAEMIARLRASVAGAGAGQ